MMKTFIRIVAASFFAALFLIIVITCWSIVIYLNADVDRARGIVTYTPPYVTFTRKEGLAKPGNLHFKDAPINLILAIISREDIEFPTDYGFRLGDNFYQFHNYLFNNMPLFGGSTITQQVVKNLFVGSEHSFYRKYKELIYAIKMNAHFTKEEIFELYLNLAETGRGTYGFAKGSELYFHKPLNQIDDAEATFLARILSSPRRIPRRLRNRSRNWAKNYIFFPFYRLELFRRQLGGPPELTTEQKAHFFSDYLLHSEHTGCIDYEHYTIVQKIWGMSNYQRLPEAFAPGNSCISQPDSILLRKKVKEDTRRFFDAYVNQSTESQ